MSVKFLSGAYCPPEIFEHITSYLDDCSLMRTATTCKELYALVTTNDHDWRARAARNNESKWISTCRNPREIRTDSTLVPPFFQIYRAVPQAEYRRARVASVILMAGSLGVGLVLWATRSIADLQGDVRDGSKFMGTFLWAMSAATTPLFFALGASICPRTLSRDVIENVYRLPGRLLTCVTHCGSSAIHRIKDASPLCRRKIIPQKSDQFDKLL